MGFSFLFISDDSDTESSSCNPRKQPLLDSCNFCKRRLDDKEDIFMYRGDTPFCSEECRQDQIDVDEAMEMKQKSRLSSSLTKKTGSSTMKKEQEVHVRAASTVVAS